MTDELDSVKYLWDGSEPGWRLQIAYRSEEHFTFLFSPNGPSLREIMALRRLLPELCEVPVARVFTLLKGQTRFARDVLLCSRAAWILRQAAAAEGLRFETVWKDCTSYLPTRAGEAMLIRDDALARRIAERMIQAGVPVDHVAAD